MSQTSLKIASCLVIISKSLLKNNLENLIFININIFFFYTYYFDNIEVFQKKKTNVFVTTD